MKTTYSPAANNGRVGSLVDKLDWYALTVPPQKEFAAQEIMRRRGFTTFCPFESLWRRKSRFTKEKELRHYPLMPRYLFVGFDGMPSWYDVFRVPLIVSVVGLEGKPAKLANMYRFISNFRNGLRRPDAERHMQTHREYKIGDTALVVEGPLAERLVKVEEITGGHAFFKLEMFGTERKLSLPVGNLIAA